MRAHFSLFAQNDERGEKEGADDEDENDGAVDVVHSRTFLVEVANLHRVYRGWCSEHHTAKLKGEEISSSLAEPIHAPIIFGVAESPLHFLCNI